LSGYLWVTDLSPETYLIRISRIGYADYLTGISLSRDLIAILSAELTAEVTPDRDGSLTVQSNPSGAVAYPDNEYKGITPLTTSNITIGNHAVLIKTDEYYAYSSG
jgi:hypothetical protein